MADGKYELTMSGYLIGELNGMADALPPNFNKERFAHNCVALVNDHPELQKFGKEKLASVMVRGALSGLDFFSGECYAIPYGDKLQYMPSFKGAKKMAMQHSTRPIKDMYAKIIRDGDIFEEEIVHGEPSINFKPKFNNKGEILGVFAVCLYADGTMNYEVMTVEEVEACRRQSKASNSPAWKNFYGEMCKKSVLHRLCKNIALDWDNASQAKDFMAGLEIETNPKEQAARDIEENANKQSLDDDEIIEVDEDGTVR